VPLEESPLTQQILAAAFEVSNTLGSGFLEAVYHRALLRELTVSGLAVNSQVPFPVHYKGVQVGDYHADLVVENRILLELKCVDRFAPEHTAQCLNYLKASGLRVAFLLNFQKPRVEYKRLVRTL
jgi:GxxExxY protein